MRNNLNYLKIYIFLKGTSVKFNQNPNISEKNIKSVKIRRATQDKISNVSKGLVYSAIYAYFKVRSIYFPTYLE